jgi:flagellar secretion chaperone FliS
VWFGKKYFVEKLNKGMAFSNNPLNAYKETQIKTASQGKLIIMLYDGAIRQIDAGIHELEASTPSLDATNSVLVKAQDVITELMVSLDFEKGGDIAQRLFDLYMYFNRQLIDANVKKDPEPLRDVRRMLDELRSTWIQIVGKNAAGDDDTGRGVNIAG